MTAYRIYTPEEVDKIAVAGALVRKCLDGVGAYVTVGTPPSDIDDYVASFARENGAATPALGFHEYPATCCVSVNHAVAHQPPQGIRLFREGDLVKVDVVLSVDGWHADSCRTYHVGSGTIKGHRLSEAAQKALELGLQAAQAGNTIGDIGFAIEQYVLTTPYTVIRQLVGHGIGERLHEEPAVPHFGRKGMGSVLKPGLVISIEPALSGGKAKVSTLPDKWTIIAADRSLTAQWEHTIAITESGPRILT